MTNSPFLTYDLPGFALEETLFGGQSFSWQALSGEKYQGIVGNKAVYAFMNQGRLVIENISQKPMTQKDDRFWQYYFALDLDYDQLKKQFMPYPSLAPCVAFTPGLRVLRQPFFETVLSFIISQNNHIPRISAIVNRLREGFGTQILPGLFSFPSPGALAGLTVEDLTPLKAGFRSKYLLDAAEKIHTGIVSESTLKTLNDHQAQSHLKQVYGIGDKVADCVLLFSQGRFSIAPMDVWMKRAMAQLFPEGFPPPLIPYSGIAQQFIFTWARAHLPKGSK